MSVIEFLSWISILQGASTLFGPHTLEGYIQEFKKMAIALAQETAPERSMEEDVGVYSLYFLLICFASMHRSLRCCSTQLQNCDYCSTLNHNVAHNQPLLVLTLLMITIAGRYDCI